MTLDTRDRNTIALAALRIFVGMLFLIFGDYKVFGAEFIWGGGFQLWINRFLVEGAHPFMIPVLQKFALPHATAIAPFRGLWRVGYRCRAHSRHSRPSGQHLRTHLYVEFAVFFKLSRTTRCLLAIFRGLS